MTNISPYTPVDNIGLQVTLSLPDTPILTTAEAKKACYIDFSDDDTEIDALVTSATEWVQRKLNRALITQTVVAEWDSVGYRVVLPYAPIQSITSVQTVDDDGTLTTVTDYYLRNGIIKYTTSVGLRVTYVAGYGDNASDVPQPIRTAIERLVKAMYDRRDDEVQETNIDKLEFNAMALLRPYIYVRS